MELDAALTQLQAATASLVAALRETDLVGLSRAELVSVVEATHRAANSLGGVQTVAVAHLAAVEDTVDVHGAWVEQHRGLGHVSLDAPGMIAPVVGITAQAATARVEVAVHQVSQTPRLVEAMLSGDLDPWRARVVTTEVEIIPKDETPDRNTATSANDDSSVDGESGSGDTTGDDTDGSKGSGGADDIVDDLLGHYAGRGRGWYETTGPLRGRVRRMVGRAHPDLVEKEAAAAREGRSVRRSPATAGTDHWEAQLPVEVSLPMWQAVEALARELKTADPSLKIDQARADALAQLVLQQADITIHLHATIPGDTTEPTQGEQAHGEHAQAEQARGEQARGEQTPAAEPEPATGAAASAKPAAAAPRRDGRLTEVGGLGATQPTLLDLDRLAATRGVRVVPSTPLTCHADTGAVIGGVVPASLARLARKDAARRSDKYVVPADMARLVRLRDGRCRFPNCVIPASRTDQDHVIAWPVGETTPTNLMCLCRRHHRVKQRHGWQARLDPDGVVHWSDPTGRPSTTYPINHLDRATLPIRTTDPQSSGTPEQGQQAATPNAATASAATPTTPDHGQGSVQATFDDIVRTHLRELDTVPSAFEDHLWRHLELTHHGSTLGDLTRQHRQAGADHPGLTWWHPTDRLTLDLTGHKLRRNPRPVSDEPPF